jgi:hypothetical protein
VEDEFQSALWNSHGIGLAERSRYSDPTVGARRRGARLSAGKYNDSVGQLRRWIIIGKAEVIDGREREKVV